MNASFLDEFDTRTMSDGSNTKSLRFAQIIDTAKGLTAVEVSLINCSHT